MIRAGQVKVNDKYNKITAIPELLDMLLIKGNIITIDAMGTQTEIAKKIIEKEADYNLAIKENQKQLSEEKKMISVEIVFFILLLLHFLRKHFC